MAYRIRVIPFLILKASQIPSFRNSNVSSLNPNGITQLKASDSANMDSYASRS
jgi:hypothetical protein